MKKANVKSLIDHLFFEFDLLDVNPKVEFIVADLIYNLLDKDLTSDELSTIAYFFNRLVCGKPLSELHGIKEEWEIGKYGGKDIFINKRCKSVIKMTKDGPAYDTEAFVISNDGGKTWKKSENHQEIQFPYLPPTNPVEILLDDDSYKYK